MANIKICPICGKQFNARVRRGAKTCSKECGEILKKQSLDAFYASNKDRVKWAICPICGKEFRQRPTGEAHSRKTCSPECAAVLQKQYWAKNEPKFITCSACGKRFLMEINGVAQKTCPKCGASGDAIWKWRICPICGKKYKADDANSRMRKTCGKECGIIMRSRSRTVYKNHEDLSGKKFGELTAKEYDSASRMWICECSCGRMTKAKSVDLENGKRKDCGHSAWANTGERIKSGSIGHREGTQINAIKHIMDGKLRKNNSSGVTGVSVHHNIKSTVYMAQITVKGKTIYLGSFKTFEEAVRARKEAEITYFGKLIKEDKLNNGKTE